jgi:RNA-directed DNA polymerase
VLEAMSNGSARHQTLAQAGRAGAARGEAVREAASDEARSTRHKSESAGQGLLERALGRENLQRAWKRVKANKGAAGVDGLDIDQTGHYLKTAWPAIKQDLLAGSEHSYGFRPGRRAHDAVLAAQAFVQSGRGIVVDVDLEKFFDRVNHDILIDRLQRRIGDVGVIRLIRAYLNSGIMCDGVVQERYQGTPQGGPLSPLLANVLLDEVDRALERRGHCFVRYADDCNVYVRSQRAAERVMVLLRRLYDKLHLKVNETKSAVASAWGRKFLGYCFRAAPNGAIKRAVAPKAQARFKQRVRQLTRRSGGRSLREVIERLRSYVLGWKAYFGLAQTPRVWRELDEWMRHRLRAIQLKQWRRGTTIYRELIALGASRVVAQKVAGNARRWWRNSRLELNRVLTIAYFDRLGMVRLS